MRQLKSISLVGALIALLLLVVGCGDTASTTDEGQEQTTVTVEKTVAEKPPPKTEQEVVPPPEDNAADSGSGGSGSITVPNVVGHDHQLAQDEMQAAGLYLLQEQDCTGQDRLLLYDRNWTVVEQDPPAGTKVGENDTITLCSKQDEE
jgi:hypothetical protein